MALPGPARLDRYGLHDPDCECARCVLGYRPTSGDRARARANYERAEAARTKAAEAKEKEAKEDVKRRLTWERLADDERATRQTLRATMAPVVRPATEAELAELRREYGFAKKRTHQ